MHHVRGGYCGGERCKILLPQGSGHPQGRLRPTELMPTQEPRKDGEPNTPGSTPQILFILYFWCNKCTQCVLYMAIRDGIETFFWVAPCAILSVHICTQPKVYECEAGVWG